MSSWSDDEAEERRLRSLVRRNTALLAEIDVIRPDAEEITRDADPDADEIGLYVDLRVDYAAHDWNRKSLETLWAAGYLRVVDGRLETFVPDCMRPKDTTRTL